MDDILREIEGMKARWMTGGSGALPVPKAWEGLDELSLLAITGQFTRVATVPASADPTTLRPILPTLAAAPLPDEFRALFRRALEAKSAPALDIVRLIAARGYCVNPMDWMPSATEDAIPPIYGPWQDWRAGIVMEGDKDTPLTAETWETFAPHLRYQHLSQLHASRPDEARTLIKEVAPGLAADQRLRLLQCLRGALTQGDTSLLEGFAGDRSTKVQSFVKTQLARLGHTTAEAEDSAVAEVADFIEIARAKLLSRKKVVIAKKLKNDAQRRRRLNVLRALSLRQIAGALRLLPEDLIEMWDLGDATEDIAAIVADTGTDPQAERLTVRMVNAGMDVPLDLISRLEMSRRTALAPQILTQCDWSFAYARPWFSSPDGTMDLATIEASKALPKLVQQTAHAEKPAEEAMSASALAFLGLVADRAAAAAILDRLTDAGVLNIDPRLTLLRLNAAL